jgi:hypothetical protein
MPSTFSPSLRIELIGAGEQAGTWGTTTNTNLGTLVEASVAGATTVSVTTANQALTIANGAADQARNAVLQLTTTTGAPFAVYAPPDPKQYTIYNASAHAATVFNSTVDGNTTAAGTGVTIPAGETMTIWSNGTNFRVQNSRIEGNITGNAATATTLQTARTINGTSFNGSANVTVPVNTTQKSDSVAYQIPFVTSVTAGNQDLFTDSAANITYNPSTNTLTTTTFAGAFTGNVTGNVTGNASTATTLQTARNIGGVSFNGSADINLPGVNTGGNQNTTGSAATLTTTRTLWGQNFNGSANVTGALSSVTTLSMSGQLTNTLAIGTAPLVITSTTRVANLNVATAGTADTLTTARTIGGVSFNGSANIDLPGVNTTGSQNTTGSAATLTTTRTLWGQNFNGSANVTGALSSVTTLAMSGQLTNTVTSGTAPLVVSSTTRVSNLNVATAGTADTLTTARTIGGVSFNGSANIDLPGVNTGGTQNTTGNAATATALQTARTIGGVSFNGTANINLPGVNAVGNQNTTGSAATLTTARTIGGVSFNGSANINLPGVNIAGNQDTTGNAATATSTPKVLTTNFTIEESGGKLLFKHGATTIASLSSTGVFTALNDVAGHGTP